MAWNPSPEVAVARDAAKKLGNAGMCIVLWIDDEGEHIGMASYGKDRQLCAAAGNIGKCCYDAAQKFIASFG